jgi:hypothetical protein
MDIKIAAYDAAIKDAERRIGSYIASGGTSEDRYVVSQVAKIHLWTKAQYVLVEQQIKEVTEKNGRKEDGSTQTKHSVEEES